MKQHPVSKVSCPKDVYDLHITASNSAMILSPLRMIVEIVDFANS